MSDLPPSVQSIITTYAARLVEAYPDSIAEIAAERDDLLAWWAEASQRQEALLDVKRIAAALAYADEGGSVAEDWELWATSIREYLLDASQQPVKPPTLPEPDLRLMGEAVKGGKRQQPVKP